MVHAADGRSDCLQAQPGALWLGGPTKPLTCSANDIIAQKQTNINRSD